MKTKRKNYHIKLISKPKFQLKYKIFAFFLILIIIIATYFKCLVTPVLFNNTKVQLSSFATKSINYAIADAMNQNIKYTDLVSIIKNENGDISHIEANSVRINLLSRTMSKIVMTNFLELSKKPISISLGTFSGITLFSGKGPKVQYDVSPYGEVFCNFVSRFDSAGVNQTYHKLYLNISLNVNVVFPFKNLKSDSEAQVLLCETVIVGKIPEVYLNSGTLTEMLNLVPEKFTS